MEDDRKFVQLVVAENNEGKRGLFQLDTKIWIKKGDLLCSLGKFWEVLDTVVEAYYSKHEIEE